MTEKPEVPKHIAKHKKLYEKGNILLETIKRSTRTSYDAGVEKHLLDKEGNVVMEKLDDVKVQEGFIKTILDSYKKNAKKALGSKKEDAHIDDLVIGAYHGVTSEAVASTIRKMGKNYTFDTHYNIMEKVLKDKVKPTLDSTARAHINKGHIGDILKYTETDKNFDSSKMLVNEAVQILEEYHKNGAVTLKHHKKELYYKNAA